MDMLKNARNFFVSGGYWTNVLVLMYPFVVLAVLAYSASLNFGLLLRLLVGATFNFIFFALLIYWISGLPNLTIKKSILRFIYFFQFIYLFVSVYHFSLYRQLIGLPTIYPIIDTNYHEAVEFAAANIRGDYFGMAILLTFPVFWFLLKPPRLPSLASGFKALPFLAVGTMFAGLASLAVASGKPYLTDYNAFLHIGRTTAIAVEEKTKISQLLAHLPAVGQVKIAASPDKWTHILVISESINRNHMSLYGYGRNTTPNLLKISDKLHVLQDACASHDNTLDALKHMLTFATDDEPEYLFKAPNLLQIMRAAGYETYWISNQQQISLGDSYISVFSKSAEHQDFVNRRALSEGVSLDEKLFEPLENILAHGPAKKFIVIHLIGAHAAYDLRYPQQYQIFDGAVGPELAGKNLSSSSATRKYNEYDNAILYSDYIAYQLIKLQHSNTPVSLLYISDHGEAIDEKDGYFGHGLDLPYRANYEIPVFFWFSPVAEALYANKIHNLQKNLDRPFQEDQTIHTLLDLYGIDYPLVNRHYSLFSERFDAKARRCDRPTYQLSALDKLNKAKAARVENRGLVKLSTPQPVAKP